MENTKKQDGYSVIVVGNTGSGKTQLALAATRQHRRLIVWDAHGEWAKFIKDAQRIEGIKHLVSVLHDNESNGVWCYQPINNRDEFPHFCKAVELAGREARAKKREHYCVVAEELASISRAQAAPDEWRELINGSRKFGTVIFSLFQRPQEVDGATKSQAKIRFYGKVTKTDIKNASQIMECNENQLPLENTEFLCNEEGKFSYRKVQPSGNIDLIRVKEIKKTQNQS